MPKVSILMPACNVEKYIRECMDSVIGQTLRDIEIIVVNDGSKDSTPAILDEYAAADDRIQVIHKVNTGYGHSMNVALDKATGDYIGIIETDDFADPEMFETLYDLAVENDLDVVKSNYYDYYATDPDKCVHVQSVNKVGVINEVFTPADHPMVFNVTPSVWSGLYRRSMLEDNHIRFTETPGASYQDTGFAFKVWASADKVMLLDEAFLHYRRDNESSSVNNPGKVFCVCDEIAEIEAFLDRNPDKKAKFEDAMNLRTWRISDWNLARLGLEYKYAFLLWMADKMKGLLSEGKLREDMLLPYEWKQVNSMAEDPQQYFRNICNAELNGIASIAEVLEENSKLKQKLKASKAKVAELREEKKELKEKLKKIKNSNSYKIGIKITSVPRAIKKSFSGQ